MPGSSVNKQTHPEDMPGSHSGVSAYESVIDMIRLLLLAFIILISPAVSSAAGPPVTPNGISLISGYRSWETIAPSYRADRNHIRVILGNPKAIEALKNNVLPFPDGSVLAKVAWNEFKHPKFPVATVPGTFSQVEFMVKDAVKYKETGGWGFARFVGNDLKPYGKDAGFVQECFACHLPVKTNDFVFTGYAGVP